MADDSTSSDPGEFENFHDINAVEERADLPCGKNVFLCFLIIHHSGKPIINVPGQNWLTYNLLVFIHRIYDFSVFDGSSL